MTNFLIVFWGAFCGVIVFKSCLSRGMRRKNARLEALLDDYASNAITWYVCPNCGSLAKAGRSDASVPVMRWIGERIQAHQYYMHERLIK